MHNVPSVHVLVHVPQNPSNGFQFDIHRFRCQTKTTD